MAGNITVLPARKTGFGEFSEAVQPYLQMAFEYLMKKKLQEPEQRRAEEKEKREAISGVSKGEYPITALPESFSVALYGDPDPDNGLTRVKTFQKMASAVSTNANSIQASIG